MSREPNEKLGKLVDHIQERTTQEEQAMLAGFILSCVDPNLENIRTFFDSLDDCVHDELIYRANDESDR